MTPVAQAYVDGLRELADWIEANGDHLDASSDFFYDNMVMSFLRHDRDEFVNVAQLLGGKRTKDGDDSYFRVKRSFGPIEVTVFAQRKDVCERVVTGTRHIPAQVIPASEERVIEARDEEIVEWVCEPLLAARVVRGDALLMQEMHASTGPTS